MERIKLGVKSSISERFNILVSLIILSSGLYRSVAQTAYKSELAHKLAAGIESGKITFKLTEEFEIIDMLGNPENKNIFQDGGMLIQQLNYPEIEVILGKFQQDEQAPFTLLAVTANNQSLDIGRNKKLVLRGNHDLKKLDSFSGFQNVSLVNVDLHDEIDLVQTMPFNNQTQWPETLPLNFDPRKILQNHKTPGLGIKKLHSQGITGKGVGIAIIDQPLLRDHSEYASRIIRYDAEGLVDFPPQMHGSSVASIAVGKNIGVAPEALLSYFAVPMWERDNSHYIRTIEKILRINEQLHVLEKIKIISISDGGFSSNSNYPGWLGILKKAGDMEILVVTCAADFIDYGTVTTALGQDPDNVTNYTSDMYSSEGNVIRIPAGNRTLASHMGNDIYAFYPQAGLSWAAPYIAGLAALACQVNPGLSPGEIITFMIETVDKTSAGPIVNPAAFMEKVKSTVSTR